MEKDISVVIIGTQWSNTSWSKTLESVWNFQQLSKYNVECLVVEGLHRSTDVNLLHTQNINALPQVVLDYLKYEDFNYYVDHFAVSDFLRRVFRVAQGKRVLLLREGDEIGNSEFLEPIEFDSPIYVLPQINNPDMFTIFNKGIEKQKYEQLITTEIIALNYLTYDAGFLVDRELAIKQLKNIKYSGQDFFYGLMNYLVWSLSIDNSCQVKMSRSIAIHPSVYNFEKHWSILDENFSSYTRELVENTKIEVESKQIVERILDQIIEITEDVKEEYFRYDALPEERVLQYSFLDLHEKINNIKLSGFNNFCVEINNIPNVSLVSSIFKGQKYIYSFLDNLINLRGFEEIELIVISPGVNIVQDLVLLVAKETFRNIRVFSLSSDPGIYNCWNYGIKNARGKYISNANLDDRRHRDHVFELTKFLDESDAYVVGCGISVTEDSNQLFPKNYTVSDLIEHFSGDVWYYDSQLDNERVFKNLEDFFIIEKNKLKQCMNFAHCMPVWRKELHDEFGYFDETQYGTYADFALWLKLLASGKKYGHLNKNLGLYLVDPNSHNRRNNNSKQWLSMVTPYLPENIEYGIPGHVEDNVLITKKNIIGKLNFGTQFDKNYGNHRSGWSYAIAGLQEFHDPEASVLVDTFIERKFAWGGDHGEAQSTEPMPYDRPWIGFIHVPPSVPSWFQFEQSNQQIFSSELWKKSVPHCKGLICLTEYHKQALENSLQPNFPISVLKHPTEFPENGFSIEKYRKNTKKRIVQIGWWLRKLNAVGYVSVPEHTPTLLGTSDWSKNIIQYAERRYFNLLEPITSKNAEVIDFLDNDQYDELLTENIIFIDFYDTSANNAVIECIARATPIVVCRHPAVEEYLGEDYPLFYDSPDELVDLINDKLVVAAHNHMRANPIREKLKLESFVRDFGECEVVKNATKQ